MRKTALILALAMAMPAWAQVEKPAADKAAEKAAPAQEAAKPEAKAEPEGKAEAPKKGAAKKHSRRMEDARHCLDKASNTEIIKCAEAYL
jgi:hypothetical protein